ncbi:hypothetical protein CQ12_33450 [Bradyrhizobium jicamae]|uniref:Uncharacterized protein n=1 Tax=Bradyrhizobium jicamae TaxID=280332 RepID=A0A0R3LET6_9BRAD|nr:hypothetical protein CQ12_33450 [Bradyrhizobium jicamae]
MMGAANGSGCEAVAFGFTWIERVGRQPKVLMVTLTMPIAINANRAMPAIPTSGAATAGANRAKTLITTAQTANQFASQFSQLQKLRDLAVPRSSGSTTGIAWVVAASVAIPL